MNGTFVKTIGISTPGEEKIGVAPSAVRPGFDHEQLVEKARNRFESITQNICGIRAKLADPKYPEDKKRVLRYNLEKLLRAEERDRELLTEFIRI